MTADLIPQALREHLAILNALDTRDGELAAQAMEQHLMEWKAFYVQRFAALAGS
jgi:DNA-binding GntR family transcriptional regulator